MLIKRKSILLKYKTNLNFDGSDFSINFGVIFL